MTEFRAGFETTLLTIIRSRELISTLVLAVVLYGFYYPAPYTQQSARRLPVAVVDSERSDLTRAIVRNLSATREVAIVAQAPDFPAAAEMLRHRQVDGIVLLPRGFTRNLLTGAPGGGVGVWVNGTYLLRARDIGSAVTAAIGGVAQARLGPILAGLHLRAPSPIIVRPLFNTHEGYKDYVFPAVASIILQQTLLFGSAMVMAERRERPGWRMRNTGFLGTWAALSMIGTLAALFYFGLIFWLQDVPRGGNVEALLVTAPLFAMAVSALGLLVGSLLDTRNRAMQVLVPTSVPLFFLTGSAWPLESMPRWVAALAELSPATTAVHLFVRLNEMGASLAEVSTLTLNMAGLVMLYGGAALLRIGNARED